MTGPVKPAERRQVHAPEKVDEVYCRRLLRPLPVAEHAQCSYCFGKEGDVRTGEHERFCDFEPGKDPIHFGFPET